MDDIGLAFDRHGLVLVFAIVLIERLGLPIPALPVLLVAGAAAFRGSVDAGQVFLVSLLASTLADTGWYVAGRLHGNRIMKFLCRISLSPDSCVRQTEATWARWGGWTLALGKFIPGVATIGAPLAGAMRLPSVRFLALNTAGAAIWTLGGIGAGFLFHSQISSVLASLTRAGSMALVLIGAVLAGYIALKWWERQRFFKTLRLARISVDELKRLIDGKKDPTIVDVRSSVARRSEPRVIPGAVVLEIAGMRERIDGLPHDTEIIFYCTCPNEVSAAASARQLIERGYTRVRPLLGGLDAWVAAGYVTEDRNVIPS